MYFWFLESFMQASVHFIDGCFRWLVFVCNIHPAFFAEPYMICFAFARCLPSHFGAHSHQSSALRVPAPSWIRPRSAEQRPSAFQGPDVQKGVVMVLWWDWTHSHFASASTSMLFDEVCVLFRGRKKRQKWLLIFLWLLALRIACSVITEKLSSVTIPSLFGQKQFAERSETEQFSVSGRGLSRSGD